MTTEPAANRLAPFVEAMVNAALDDEHWAWAFDVLGSDQAVDFMEFVLRAALELTTTTCPTCEGLSYLNEPEWSEASTVGVPKKPCPNRDCDGGRVPAETRLVLGKRIGFALADTDWPTPEQELRALGLARHESKHVGVPVFVPVAVDEEDET